MHPPGAPARLLLLHDALRAYALALGAADRAPLGATGAQQARRVAAAVRALKPLTAPELKASEESALSSYLQAVFRLRIPPPPPPPSTLGPKPPDPPPVTSL